MSSKHTERGIGQHVGPAADGRVDDTRPRLASETPIVGDSGRAGSPTPQVFEKVDRDGKPLKVDVGQITLLGVPAPELDREKVTTPGRDVHLPTEVRRVAAPRSVAVENGTSGPSDRRRTPEVPRPRVTADSAPAIALHTQDVISTVNTRADRMGEAAAAAYRSSGRREFGETTMMAAVEESRPGGPIALGIAMSLVTALVVVWGLRFGPHLPGADSAVAHRSSGPTASGSAAAEPATPPRLPAVPPAGERFPAANDVAGAGTNVRAPEEPQGLPPAAARNPVLGSAVDDPAVVRPNPAAAPREAPGAPPASPALADEDTSRKNQRLRITLPPAGGERTATAGGGPKRGSGAPAFRPTDPRGPVFTPPPPGAEPPRFEAAPPAAPARAAPARDERAPYDPDSPLPPATSE